MKKETSEHQNMQDDMRPEYDFDTMTGGVRGKYYQAYRAGHEVHIHHEDGTIEKQYFTVEQANAVVRAIRPLVAELLQIRGEIRERQPDLWPVIERSSGNGGSQLASQMAVEFGRVDKLVREVYATGAILRDLNLGLVDFLAQREGRDVYLCWRYGEEEIEYWHEIDGGYQNRKLIV